RPPPTIRPEPSALFFFFTDTATPEIYTLSLHDALPILVSVALEMIKARGVTRGASTITQQVAKNLFLTPDQTLGRKVQEAILAIWLEQNYTKEEILELYMNRVYFGAGATGIEAAAQTYFGVSA